MGLAEGHSEHTKAPWWCYLLLVAAVFSASSAGVVLTWIGPVPPITLAAWRLQLTGVIAALCAVPQWYQLPAEQRRQFFKDVGWSVFSGSCLALHFGAWVWSLQHTSLAHSVLLVCTAPVILVAAAVLMRQPISPGEIAAAVLAVAGCGVLTAGAASGREEHVTVIGDLAAFSAAIAVVAHWHAGKILRRYQPVFVYSAPVTLWAAVLLTVVGYVAESCQLVGHDNHGVFGWLTSKQYAPFVIYLGCVPGIIGHQGFNTVLKYLSPLMVGLGVQFEPIIAPLLGWLMGLEKAPGLFTWVGGAVVLLATVWASVATHRRESNERQVMHLVKHKSLRTMSFSADAIRFEPVPEEDEDEVAAAHEAAVELVRPGRVSPGAVDNDRDTVDIEGALFEGAEGRNGDRYGRGQGV